MRMVVIVVRIDRMCRICRIYRVGCILCMYARGKCQIRSFFHLVTVQTEYTSRGIGGEPEKQRPTPSSHHGEIIGRIGKGSPLLCAAAAFDVDAALSRKLLVATFDGEGQSSNLEPCFRGESALRRSFASLHRTAHFA